MPSDEAPACLLASNTLPACDAAAEAETVEIMQVALSEQARHQLQTAGKSAGVKILLSRANRQALQIRG